MQLTWLLFGNLHADYSEIELSSKQGNSAIGITLTPKKKKKKSFLCIMTQRIIFWRMNVELI